MDYNKHYTALISRAKERGLDKAALPYYTEKHHIVPRCIGGTDDESNLVLLTGAEHFVAHQLLAKMHRNNHSLVHATKILMGSCNYNNKQFEWVRKLAVQTSIKFHKGRKRSEQTRKNISNALKGVGKGVKFTEEHKQKLSEALTGRVFSEEHRRKLSARVVTEEWRQKISKARKGKPLSKEAAAKIRAATSTPEAKAKHRAALLAIPKIECPYCGKKCSPTNHKRWHGENCKAKPNVI